ncbi:MAG: hypothetical protein FJ191_00820 [Gammaproteobacteria bacterium]|nr:hypothetical protein [Gammaproteobacteria bacterium]
MTSHEPKRLAVRLAAALTPPALVAPVAGAYEITYEFTADGLWYDRNGINMDYETTADTVAGFITFNVLTVSPPNPSFEYDVDGDGVNDGNEANSWGDWVRTETVITDSVKGQFEPGPVGNTAVCSLPDESTGPGYYAAVGWYFDFRQVSQTSGKAYGCWSDDGYTLSRSEAWLDRTTYWAGEQWFTGFDFVTRLAPPPYNSLYLINDTLAHAGGDWVIGAGFVGLFYVNVDTWRVSLAPLAAAAASLGNPGRGLAQAMKMAQAYYAAGDLRSACLMLAAFQHQASHAHGPALSQEMSDKLTADSTAVMEALGCN